MNDFAFIFAEYELILCSNLCKNKCKLMLLRESSTTLTGHPSYKEIEIMIQKKTRNTSKNSNTRRLQFPLVMFDRSVAYSSLIGPRTPTFGGASSLLSNGEIGITGE